MAAGKRSSFWPPVDTREAAQELIDLAFWASLFLAGVSALIIVLTAVGYISVGMETYLTVLLGGLMLLLLAWGFRKRSRAAAVLGGLFYGINVLVAYDAGRVRHPIAAIAQFYVMLAFIHGVRGVFAWHRLSAPTSDTITTRA
jgi:hypothetical protein